MVRSTIVTSGQVNPEKVGTYETKVKTYFERDENYGQRKLVEFHKAGKSEDTTRHRATLAGILSGFKCLSTPANVKIVTDSDYAIKALTKEDVSSSKNIDLITKIKDAASEHQIQFVKISRNNNFAKPIA